MQICHAAAVQERGNVTILYDDNNNHRYPKWIWFLVVVIASVVGISIFYFASRNEVKPIIAVNDSIVAVYDSVSAVSDSVPEETIEKSKQQIESEVKGRLRTIFEVSITHITNNAQFLSKELRQIEKQCDRIDEKEQGPATPRLENGHDLSYSEYVISKIDIENQDRVLVELRPNIDGYYPMQLSLIWENNEWYVDDISQLGEDGFSSEKEMCKSFIASYSAKNSSSTTNVSTNRKYNSPLQRKPKTDIDRRIEYLSNCAHEARRIGDDAGYAEYMLEIQRLRHYQVTGEMP